MANYDDTLQAAREQAETQLDGILAIMREELHAVPSEHRFEMMLMIMSRLNVDPFVSWVALTVALERILLREELDRDLAPPSE